MVSIGRTTLTIGTVVGLLASATAYDNGAPFSQMPPLGWSSWVGLGPGSAHPIFDYCDEAGVKAAADAFIESGLYDHGYRHFHLDDCWAGGRNESGYLYAEKDHFPNNMKPVIDYVHSKGLVFGLYTCGGPTTCVGGRPGSKGHWQEDAAVFAEWGVDWVKMDWCGGRPQDPLQAYTNMSKAMNSTGRHMHFNMCEWGTADDAGQFPWQWGPEVAQSWRMGGDHTPVWESTKGVISQVAQHAADYPGHYSGHPYAWNDMDMLETGNYAQAAHANGKEGTMTATEYKTEFSMWAICASPLTVTTPIMNCTTPPGKPVEQCTVSLVKQESIAKCIEGTSFGCDSKSGMMWTNNGCRGEFLCNNNSVQCDVDGDGIHSCSCSASNANVTCKAAMTDLQKEILFNDDIIAINQDVTPQGLPVVPKDTTIWARFLSNGSVAVAFYNEDDSAKSIQLQFSALSKMTPLPVPSAANWGSTTKASVRDLWEHTELGISTGMFPTSAVSVAPHETKVYLLSALSH